MMTMMMMMMMTTENDILIFNYTMRFYIFHNNNKIIFFSLFIIHSENLLIYNPSYVIDREQHARVRRTRSQQTRKQTSIKSPDAAFFVQRPHGIPVPFEPSLGWVQLIRHHRGFNHIDRVEERPIENPAQTSGEANLRVARFPVFISRREPVLRVFKHPKIYRTRG
tara:strand:- start:15 stop:512 length:498 start_codon:yes stop_codon:yes gene_type:complete